MDNIDVAILTKTNALAERFGLKAYDFSAEVHPLRDKDGDMIGIKLAFESVQLKELLRVRNMLKRLKH